MNPRLSTSSAIPQVPKAFELDPSLSGLTFTGTVRSELIKLIALRTTWWMTGITIVLGSVIAFAVAFGYSRMGADTPGAAEAGEASVASAGMAGNYVAMMVLGALGVIAMTTEFTSGAVRSSLTAVPRRNTLLGAKAVALSLWTGSAGLVLLLLSHFLLVMMTDQIGMLSPVTDSSVAAIYGANWLVVVLTALMGFGLGALTRSSAGGIVVLAVVLFVVQVVLAIVWTASGFADWAENLMSIEYNSLVSAFTGGEEAETDLEAWQGGLGILIWVAVSFIAGWVNFLRRDW